MSAVACSAFDELDLAPRFKHLERLDSAQGLELCTEPFETLKKLILPTYMVDTRKHTF